MSNTVDLTIFGTRLQECLDLHGMTPPQLAERTAIEEQRIRALLEHSEPRYYELIGIADAFRIQLAAFVSPETKFPVATYRPACKHYDPDMGVFSNTDSLIEIDTDDRIKINKTLLACQFLQEIWEKSNFSGRELSWSVDTSVLSEEPEEAGRAAARQFRDEISRRYGEVRHDMITPNLRQYARQVGVHVFRQKINSTENTSQKRELYGVCLFEQIGKNKNGRIVIYSSDLPYHAEQFCIAHELCHAFLDAPESFPPTDRSGSFGHLKPDSKKERMADAFASELLLPQEYLSAHANDIRKFGADGLLRFCEEVSCCVTMTTDKLWSQGLIEGTLRDVARTEEGIRIQRERYSPQLRELLNHLVREGYAGAEVEGFKDLIDKGLSHHFVVMCQKASANEKEEDETIAHCADIFSVPEFQIEKAFEMYRFIDMSTLPANP